MSRVEFDDIIMLDFLQNRDFVQQAYCKSLVELISIDDFDRHQAIVHLLSVNFDPYCLFC